MSGEVLGPVIAALPYPTVLVGQDDLILHANDRATQLLGGPVRGRHFIAVLRQPNLLDAIETCLRDGTDQETQYLGSAGTQDTSFVVKCAPVETSEGRAALVTFEDITHLQQAIQMRRDFVANVSHELRTPLTALMGFIETLKGPARDDPAASVRFLDIMQSEAGRMERLVHDLLSLSRVEAEERRRPTTILNLGETIKSALHTLRSLASETGNEITLSVPEQPVMVPADADQMTQVMTNLVENAIKHGGPGKRVDIVLNHIENAPLVRGPAAEISVRDQGPGIETAHLSRLTERFYRIDTHRARETGGTGLGLAIVKHIINRHRGRLRIISEVGQGSTFKVILPLD